MAAATRDDIPDLARVKTLVARRNYAAAHAGADLNRWLEEHCGEKHYRYRVGRSGYDVLVARDRDGEIVGVATMRQRGKRADMSGLYVLYPGQGIGTELVAARERLARERGCTRVRASVWRTNERAKAFVVGRGFERVGGYRESTVGVMVEHYERDL